jgi:transcriptional repressor NrdR
MRCPHCGNSQSRVIETRVSDDAIRRRRECERCELRFTTYERTQLSRLVVRASTGAQRSFTKAWLANALRLAAAELPVATCSLVAGAVEAQLRVTSTRVVSTEDIAMLAARQVSQIAIGAFGQGLPSSEQITIALERTLPARRSVPSQLPLPLER